MDSAGEEEQHRGKKTRKKSKRLKVTMEYVTPSEGQMAPIVGYFPSGYDPCKEEEEEGKPLEVQVYQHVSRPNRMQVVARPAKSNVEFVGTSYTGEAATPQLCKYSLGIFDKESQTLKIVPVAANKIFRLEPKLKGNEDEDAEEELEVITEENMWERNRETLCLYGSKKIKKYAKRQFKMQLQADDHEVQAYLKNEVQSVEMNVNTESTASKAVHNIPPHDLTANVPEKAYVLDRIIPKSEWSHLNDILEILESENGNTPCEKFMEMGYSTFVSNRIEKLKEIKDEEEKRKYARILSYITHLVNFLNMSSERGFKSKVQAGITGQYVPHVIFQRFISLFVDPVSHLITHERKELLISYVLVLTLFADNFHTYPRDISKDLKMTIPSLRPCYLNLGCSIRVDGLQWYCLLEVPLNLPGITVPQKRTKRRP